MDRSDGIDSRYRIGKNQLLESCMHLHMYFGNIFHMCLSSVVIV